MTSGLLSGRLGSLCGASYLSCTAVAGPDQAGQRPATGCRALAVGNSSGEASCTTCITGTGLPLPPRTQPTPAGPAPAIAQPPTDPGRPAPGHAVRPPRKPSRSPWTAATTGETPAPCTTGRS